MVFTQRHESHGDHGVFVDDDNLEFLRITHAQHGREAVRLLQVVGEYDKERVGAVELSAEYSASGSEM